MKKKKFSKVLQYVKLEKNKINFNKFIWLYWKMKKKKFFGGFSVAGMRKKNEKNKKHKLEWATAHLVVESRYIVLYRDRHGLGALGGATRLRGLVGGRSGPPRYSQLGCNTTGPRARASGACVRAWLLGECVGIQ